MRLLVAFGAVSLAFSASAFHPPLDEKAGVELRILGFDETATAEQPFRLVDGMRPLDYEVAVSNGTDSTVSGSVASCLNDDWLVETVSRAVVVPPGLVRKVSFVARPKTNRVESGFYPVHATFGELHAIALFKAEKPQRPWNKVAPLWEWWLPSAGELWTAAERKEADWRAAEVAACCPTSLRFVLADGVTAHVLPGDQGLTDGVIVFEKGNDRVAWRGFAVCVDGEAVGATQDGRRRFARTEIRRADSRACEVLHWLARKDGSELLLRATLKAEQGALRIKWDMPEAVRAEDGTPRYTALYIGTGSENPDRIYAGMGAVVTKPKKYELRGGPWLAVRHVGADYPCGISVVQAADVFPDYFIVSAQERKFQLIVQHDATFSLVPSTKGVFAAAKRYADIVGFRPSPGYGRCASRLCLDDWWSSFSTLTESVRNYAEYGVTNAVLIKHGWSKWGYDYRAPDYHPAGEPEKMRTLSETARSVGMDYGVHENYIDFYPDAAGFSYDCIMHAAVSGQPKTAWYNVPCRAQSYRACPERMYPFAERNAKRAKEDFGATALFIDVFGAMQPLEYYDRFGRFHTRMECAFHWGNIYDRYRTWLGKADAVMVSEAGTDALVGHLDAGQCDHPLPECGGRRGVDFDDGERIPWHDIVTHGTFAMMGGGLPERYGKPYGSDDYLETTAVGGRMPMCSGTFSRSGVMTDWLLRPWWVCVANSRIKDFRFDGNDIRHRIVGFENGAALHSNRSTNSNWRVGGVELPGYGFVARGPGYSGGIVCKDGQRVAFARTPTSFFADARPLYDKPVDEPVSAWIKRGRVVSWNRLSIAVGWKVRRAVPGVESGFVHVLEADNDNEGPILFGGTLGVSPERFLRVGEEFESELEVIVPESAHEGRYAVRFGILQGGRRVAADAVRDGQNRMLGGILCLAKDTAGVRTLIWERPLCKNDVEMAEARSQGLNATGKTIDFGGIRTDGAFRLDYSDAQWEIRPLPASRRFSAMIDLAEFGKSGHKVAAVTEKTRTGVLEWRQEGDRLAFTSDGRSACLTVTFEKEEVKR